ncbi:hypothetical protein F4808DRAFT_473243 [Astrocystis sublimbata]|nr:hypothetical protein F4808DRAFT_473243 [Astrocystis sublimbata]
MSAFLAKLEAYKGSFLKTDPSTMPEIICVIIGGSRLYASENDESLLQPRPRDYNGIIVMRTKLDIYYILSSEYGRQRLFDLVGIVVEESCPYPPAPNTPLFAGFDGIRISGYDGSSIPTSTKRSIKVLSLEMCVPESKTTLNIISGRDRRVWDGIELGTHEHDGEENVLLLKILMQASTIDNSLALLHDQWLYYKKDVGDSTSLAAFGPTADLLLTGACVYGENPYVNEFKHRIIRHYVAKTGYLPTLSSFRRYPRFQAEYANWLRTKLNALSRTLSAPPFEANSQGLTDHVILLGDTVGAMASSQLSLPFHTHHLTEKAESQFNAGLVSRQETNRPLFSQNSTSYRVATLSPNPVEIFVKVTSHAEDELRGAIEASHYFPGITMPRLASSGELLYPYFPGQTVSDARLAYIKTGRQNSKLLNSILHAELVLAQDTLCAYRRSLSLTTNTSDHRQNIQRFYCDRLLDDRRMCNFYKKGISLNGKYFSLGKLFSLRWIVNGEEYPSLRESFTEAGEILRPGSERMTSCPMVFGLGDAHSGNVMYSPKDLTGCTNEVRLIDYEVAGFHPVMLDFAKQIYNTVFFETIDQLLMPSHIKLALEFEFLEDDNTMVVGFAPHVDALTQALLDIKLRYLVKPICDEVRERGGSLKSHLPVLSSALFLCATLARDCSSSAKAFVSSFATGLIFSQCKTWHQLAVAFEELGFDSKSANAIIEHA